MWMTTRNRIFLTWQGWYKHKLTETVTTYMIPEQGQEKREYKHGAREVKTNSHHKSKRYFDSHILGKVKAAECPVHISSAQQSRTQLLWRSAESFVVGVICFLLLVFVLLFSVYCDTECSSPGSGVCTLYL